MGEEPEQTLFPRRHADGQQIPEKMFNFTSYKDTANQNHNDIQPHTVRMTYQ